MKRIILIVCTVIFTLCHVCGQTPVEPQEDSVLLGHHFVNQVKVYSLSGEYEVRDIDGEYEDYNIEAMMLPSGEFIKIEINGVEIISIGDDPVLAIPRPIEGTVERLWLWVDGLDANRNYTCYGHVSKAYPQPGQIFEVILRARMQTVTLKVPLPTGINPADTFMVLNGDDQFDYDVRDGGYDAYISVTTPNQTYEIWYNGSVIATGTITVPHLEAIPDEINGMQFRVKLPGNIDVVDLTDSGVEPFYKGQTTEGGFTTLIDGTPKAAKVFTVIQNGKRNLSVELDKVTSASFTVFTKGSNGDLVQISETFKVTQQWGWVNADLDVEGYTNVIIVITDVVYENYFSESFDVRFYPYYGGGKG